jgi:thymidylate kinase
MSPRSAAAGPGAFITIEGPDGGGKTTQAERLR